VKNSEGKDILFNFTQDGKVSVKEYGAYTAFFSRVNYPDIASESFTLNFIDKTERLKFLYVPDRFIINPGGISVQVI